MEGRLRVELATLDLAADPGARDVFLLDTASDHLEELAHEDLSHGRPVRPVGQAGRDRAELRVQDLGDLGCGLVGQVTEDALRQGRIRTRSDQVIGQTVVVQRVAGLQRPCQEPSRLITGLATVRTIGRETQSCERVDVFDDLGDRNECGLGIRVRCHPEPVQLDGSFALVDTEDLLLVPHLLAINHAGDRLRRARVQAQHLAVLVPDVPDDLVRLLALALEGLVLAGLRDQDVGPGSGLVQVRADVIHDRPVTRGHGLGHLIPAIQNRLLAQPDRQQLVDVRTLLGTEDHTGELTV